MDAQRKTPKLLEFYFGAAAETAQRGASQRLRRWCRAFDEWLADRDRHLKADAHKQALLAWRRLARQCQKMPWELEPADFAAHAAWMEQEGYAARTIACALGYFASFYRWCAERGVDGERGSAFNPAAQVARPVVRPFEGATLLSRQDILALLEILARDLSPVGRRDRAFFLARLGLGAPLSHLRQLRWGQIELDAAGAAVWVRWQPGAERASMPDEAWQALHAYLQASGRLAGMGADHFVFAPLREPASIDLGTRAGDWAQDRCVSACQLLSSLKLYGRLAGIPEDRLTLQALRRTALRLRLDQGDTLEQLKAFLGSREHPRSTRYRLGKLPQLPAGEPAAGEGVAPAPEPPIRHLRQFQPGDGLVHGFYARRGPDAGLAEAVEQELSRGPLQAMEAEVGGLRQLERGLLERQAQAGCSQERVDLWQAYSLAALRMGVIIRGEAELQQSRQDNGWAEDFLAMLDATAEQQGQPPVAQAIQKEAAGAGLEPAGVDQLSQRGMLEEIAALRLTLKQAHRLALETPGHRDYIHLVELYSLGCVRLLRLLKLESRQAGRLKAHLNAMIDRALQEVVAELGIGIPPS